MKCGLICARRARTSASISRVREASSSASSSCPETQRATSFVARTSPAEARPVKTCRVPTTFSSTSSGATMAWRTTHDGSAQATSAPSTTVVRPWARVPAEITAGWWAWCERPPSHASSPVVSVIATAVAPRSERRCLSDFSAAAGVRPIRSGGEASRAVCRVR